VTLTDAHLAHRQALCAKAFHALARTPDVAWIPEFAPLTQAERAIVTSAVRREREKREVAA
jgi:hypothetical protein